jgi:hypothetical protein
MCRVLLSARSSSLVIIRDPWDAPLVDPATC